MNQIIVIVKSESGVLIPCKPSIQQDGVVWECGNCSEICCRVSFGVMNGFWRCRCGLETEVTVDGKIVDLKQFNTEPKGMPAVEMHPAVKLSDFVTPQPQSSDEKFLQMCGIAAEPIEP